MRSRELILIATLLGACGGASRRGEPAAPPVIVTSAQEARGHVVFDHLCYKCHPGGEQGLGVGLNDKPLPEFVIRTQVRRGIGAMPEFSRDELSEADLDAVVEYVQALHEAPSS
jgi:mono/diheme cytochrome c family protein